MKKRSPLARRAAAKAPPPRAPGYDDILAIARLIESGSRFSEFRLRSGDIEVEVKRANGAPGPAAGATLAPPVPKAAEEQAASANSPGYAHDLPPGTEVIRSPMVGTFYRAPEPGAAPFVKAGARVEPDTIVCIIEVMKLMNSVVAGVAGVVTHVFVENAATVEYGQPLVAIRPAK